MANELQMPNGKINIFNFRKHIAYIEQAEGRIAEKEEKLNIQAQEQAEKEKKLNKLEEELTKLRVSLQQYQESLDIRDAHYFDREFDLTQREEKLQGFADPIEFEKFINEELENIKKIKTNLEKVSTIQAKTAKDQKRTAIQQAEIAEDQKRTAARQANEDEQLKARQKKLSESEAVLSRQPEGSEEIGEEEKINISVQKKRFEDVISESIKDFKNIIKDLKPLENLSKDSADSALNAKKFVLYRLRASYLGILAAYANKNKRISSIYDLRRKYYNAIGAEMVKIMRADKGRIEEYTECRDKKIICKIFFNSNKA